MRPPLKRKTALAGTVTATNRMLVDDMKNWMIRLLAVVVVKLIILTGS